MTDDTAKKKPQSLSAAQIQADLEARRAELADTIDGLTAQLDPRTNIAELKSQVADTAANASEEAQEFVSRLRRGDRSAQDLVGFAAAALTGLLGVILIRRRR